MATTQEEENWWRKDENKRTVNVEGATVRAVKKPWPGIVKQWAITATHPVNPKDSMVYLVCANTQKEDTGYYVIASAKYDGNPWPSWWGAQFVPNWEKVEEMVAERWPFDEEGLMKREHVGDRLKGEATE